MRSAVGSSMGGSIRVRECGPCRGGCAMPSPRVAGDERSEPPVASGRGCDGCALVAGGVLVARSVEFWMFAAASMPPEPPVLRELRALGARRDSDRVMPPRPRGGRSVALGPHRSSRPGGSRPRASHRTGLVGLTSGSSGRCPVGEQGELFTGDQQGRIQPAPFGPQQHNPFGEPGVTVRLFQTERVTARPTAA